jgi:HPt (histidine-containing phosphotransfer) domain-containing protein
MSGDRAKCLEAGMDEHLAKPVRLDDLKRVLDLWIEPPAVAHSAAPPVDLARLVEITDSDSAMFRRIANEYLVQAGEILALMGIAIDRRDRHEIHHLAHKLGGSSASCGITAMLDPLSRLEHMGESFQPVIARDLYQQASTNLVNVRHFFHAHHQSLKSDP